ESGIQKLKRHVPHIYITVGYKGAVLAEHVIKLGVDAVFNTEGKGNSWWIYNTFVKYHDSPLFVLTCDNVIEIDFDELAKEYYELGQPALMVVPVTPIKGLDGDYIFHEQNKVVKISRTDVSDIYCSGIQVMNPAKVNRLTDPTESFYEVWNQLLAKNELFCSTMHPERWLAIDTVEQLHEARNKK
ncbi:MAG TPA: NDP-sugar synthase, partial [Bacteroidia bacterium]|nr:NDP-sugar synthase [Bacteroidia bacterium]